MARLIKIADWSGGKRGNVVFIHGLGGHPYDTWRRTPDDGSFWPLWMAEDVKGISVYSYGYHSPPTNWLGTAMPLLDEAAQALRILLNNEDLKTGPITFVCHSLGGLMAKSIIRAAKEQSGKADISSFHERVKQVVFIATPHTGAGKATLLEWLSWLAWPSASSRNLVANNAELRHLNFGYRTLTESRNGALTHLVYYEMLDTLVGGIVAPASADPGLPNCTPVPIREDHITIAKPKRRDELVYSEVRTLVEQLSPLSNSLGELRTYPLEPFAMGWSWKQFVPKLVRIIGLGLLIVGAWKGLPLVMEEWRDYINRSIETHREVKKLAADIAELKARQSPILAKPEAISEASKSLETPIERLATATDTRSKAAFDALRRGDTSAAEALFTDILKEKSIAGQAANREAAEAARNIAAFSRLTDVAKAAELYGRAAKLDPDNVQNWVDLGDMITATGRVERAKAAFEQALASAERLAKSDPGNTQWQRDLAVSQIRIGDVLVAQGDLTGALDAYRASLDIAERLAKSDPDNTQWQRELSVPQERIGNVLVAQGDRTGALDVYRASLAIRARLVKKDPGNTQWQRDLSVSQDRIGDVLFAQGDLTGALEAYRASLDIAEQLAKADPGNTQWQRDLSVSQDRIGDVLVAHGDLTSALNSFRASLAIRERLAKADPGHNEWQHDLSVSQDRIGDVLVAQGDLTGALDAYRASLYIAERLAKADPGHTQWQRDLSVPQNKIGDMLFAQGDLTGALEAYRVSLAIREQLVKEDPGNTQWQRDLAVSWERIGNVLVAQGERTGALDAYRASLTIRERLVKADPGNTQWQRDLSVSQNKIGDMLVAQGDRTGALDAYRASLAIRQRLVKLDPSNTQWQHDLAWIMSRLTTME